MEVHSSTSAGQGPPESHPEHHPRSLAEGRKRMQRGLAIDRAHLIDFLRGLRGQPALSAAPDTADGDSARRRFITLIEDDDIDAAVTQSMLSAAQLGELQVTRFKRLGDAKQHLRRGQSEVILVDLGLPDAHGLEAVRAVRKLAPATPLIVLSGNGAETVAIQSLQEGAQDYVFKGSLDTAVLGKTVRLALSRADAERSLRRSVVRLLVRSDELLSEIEWRHEIEDQLLQEQERLSEVISALEKANVDRTEFLATVSHELRTPLTSIIGYTDLLSSVPDVVESAVATSALEVVGRNSQRLLALVEDLLITAELDSEGARMRLEWVNLQEVVDAVAQTIQPMADRHAQRLSMTVDDRLPAVWGDKSRLERALFNVIGNAIKFTPEGGAIELSARAVANDENVELSVSDTGPGIPPDEVDQLFEQFARGSHAVTNEVPGTGLGLAIAKSIIVAHKGHISVNSVLGAGTSVTFTIPVDLRESKAGCSSEPFEAQVIIS